MVKYCASAMLTIMTRKMIRASRGTAPTRQRRHGSGDTNAYAMFCSKAQTAAAMEARVEVAEKGGATVVAVMAAAAARARAAAARARAAAARARAK